MQFDTPDTVYPALHVGWHLDPLNKLDVHVPTPPFVGAFETSHQLGRLHVADVNTPAVQLDAPDTV